VLAPSWWRPGRELGGRRNCGMITLSRHGSSIDLTPFLRDAAQILAKQEGWRPVSAVDTGNRQRHSVYQPGRLADSRDARAFAAAFQRSIDGEHGDTGEMDPGALAAVVNVVRDGPFAIL
jgi:hypothetical protein